MKQISIYFGKQQDSVLGSYADIVKLAPIDDKDADEFVGVLTQKNIDWATIRLQTGIKVIRLQNILWIDVVEIEEKENKENV